MIQEQLLPSIEETILTLDIKSISEERKELLNPLISYLKQKISNHQPIALNFICTHNSRRSHLSQVWAQTTAHYVGINNINCYSGGTEATAMFPVAADTLKNNGFEIKKLSQTENPVYSIKYANNAHPIIGFSKTFDDSFNPESNFGAIMTCSSADKGCPIVSGSDGRFPITYDDPKAFDNTSQQAEKYKERSIQIATEMLYVMQNAAV
jgi:arsenate reductase